MTMYRLLFLILLFTGSFITRSQDLDNLKPAESTFTDMGLDYHSKIRKKLLVDLSEFPIARTIVCPSFEPEFAISIETKQNKNGDGNDNSKKYLILRTCNPSIWNSILQHNDSSIVLTKEILIDSIFAQTIEDLFKTAISKARFSLEPTIGLDGTFYYFVTTIIFEGIHCGFTWTPTDKTKMGELCQISLLMRDFCETKDLTIRNEILEKSRVLIRRFEDNYKIEQQANFERYVWISITSLLIIGIAFLIVIIIKRKLTSR